MNESWEISRVPVTLLSLFKSSEIIVIILLIESLDFRSICFFHSRCKTRCVVLDQKRNVKSNLPLVIGVILQPSDSMAGKHSRIHLLSHIVTA